MSTPASIARHPIHPVLVAFPVGSFVTALVLDILARRRERPARRGAGFVDSLSLQGRARRTATWHMILNLGLGGLFAVNWMLRTSWGARWIPPASNIPLILTAVGVVILGVSVWLGGTWSTCRASACGDRLATRACRAGAWPEV